MKERTTDVLDRDQTIAQPKSEDDRPAIVRYVGEALSEWPPLFSVEDDGTRDDYAYVALRLELFQGEYYPFSDLQKRLDEYDIVAEEVGIDTTSENDLPRLLLQIDTSETPVNEDMLADG
jgi:predicted Zn-dependent peptidase